jgi:protein-S-isoprenylcysteine O-methyltransferase Ste14
MIAPPSFLPLLAFAAAAGITLVRIAELKLGSHVDAIVVHGGTDARALLEKLFGASILAAALFSGCYAADPDLSQTLGAVPALQQPAIAWFGATLAFLGTAVIGIAQFTMGDSWRIGIPKEQRNRLVTEGIYRWSRNPIYAGMVGALAGVFLMAPNAVTLALLAAASVSAAVQIRIEEAFLRDIHGPAFDAYFARTRRWV